LVGVSAFYLLAIAGRFGTWSNSVAERALSTLQFQVVVWLLLLLLAAFTWYTLWRARDADAKNRKLAEEAENEIRRLVASPEFPAIFITERHENINRHVLVRHGTFIVFLAILVACLLTLPIPK